MSMDALVANCLAALAVNLVVQIKLGWGANVTESACNSYTLTKERTKC